MEEVYRVGKTIVSKVLTYMYVCVKLMIFGNTMNFCKYQIFGNTLYVSVFNPFLCLMACVSIHNSGFSDSSLFVNSGQMSGLQKSGILLYQMLANEYRS